MAPLAALLLGLSVVMPIRAQTVDAKQSEISFVTRQMGVPVEGRFKTWQAQIAFDPAKPEGGKVSFTIETGSAHFGAPETDSEVVKPVWFNVAQFPKATFQSSAVKALGGGKYEVSGTLNVKGKAQAVVVPVTLAQQGAAGTATGSFVIKRLDFKIGENEWADTSMVANDVQVKFKLTLTGLAVK